MRRMVLLVGVVAVAMSIGVGSASAFVGGGRTPGEAPLIAYGQHYLGELDNHLEDANYVNGYRDTVAIYKLPALSTRDQLTVDWQEAPFTHESGFPVQMVLLQGVNDYNWGEVFADTALHCCGETSFKVSGSGTAQTPITVQTADSTSSYLMFYATAQAESDEPQRYETFPYSFSVEPPRHYLGVSLGAVSKVATNGYLHATASLVTGAPAPDGTAFTLTGTWSGGAYTSTMTSGGGQVTYPLALPETAVGKDVEFVVTSAASIEYQAATSPKVFAEVTKPPAPPAPPAPAPAPKPANLCKKATNKAHALARMYKRQLKNAERVRGRHRRRLLKKGHATEREFLAARTAKQAAC
jgi:hypothetical protein